MINYESPSARTLLAIAQRDERIDAERCGLVFAQLGAAARQRDRLREALARHKLSDLEFATLVVLFGCDPEPMPMAVLAAQTAVTRSGMTGALDKLEAHGFASRARDRTDRRVIHVCITAMGRGKVDQAISDYLREATDAARSFEELETRELPVAFAHVQRGL